MALIKCPECGKEYSDTATACPNCGYIKKKKKNKAWIIFLVILLILAGVVVSVFLKKKPTDNQQKTMASEFPEMEHFFELSNYEEADKYMCEHMSLVNSATRRDNREKYLSNHCFTTYDTTIGTFDNQGGIDSVSIVYYDEDMQVDNIRIEFGTNVEQGELYKQCIFESFGDDYTTVFEDNRTNYYWKDGSILITYESDDSDYFVITKGFCGSDYLGTNTRTKKK